MIIHTISIEVHDEPGPGVPAQYHARGVMADEWFDDPADAADFVVDELNDLEDTLNG